jgi:hypothetical protein
MTVELDLHPSRYFLAFIFLTHVGAMLFLLALPLQAWAMLLIEVFLVASFAYSVYKYIVRTAPTTIIKLWVDEQKRWYGLQRNETVLSLQLKGDSVCSQWLVILNFNVIISDRHAGVHNKKISAVIFPDSVTKTEFRRLKAWMNSH